MAGESLRGGAPGTKKPPEAARSAAEGGAEQGRADKCQNQECPFAPYFEIALKLVIFRGRGGLERSRTAPKMRSWSLDLDLIVSLHHETSTHRSCERIGGSRSPDGPEPGLRSAP